MAAATEVVEHGFHVRCYLRGQLVTVVTGPTAGLVDKIVVTVGTGHLVVIEMLEGNRQLWPGGNRGLAPAEKAIGQGQ
jgi:hypothetical protein